MEQPGYMQDSDHYVSANASSGYPRGVGRLCRRKGFPHRVEVNILITRRAVRRDQSVGLRQSTNSLVLVFVQTTDNRTGALLVDYFKTVNAISRPEFHAVMHARILQKVEGSGSHDHGDVI